MVMLMVLMIMIITDNRYAGDDRQVGCVQVVEAETEAAHWQEELKAQQRQFEAELDKHRQEAELLRVIIIIITIIIIIALKGAIRDWL